ncbi:MAG: thiosulfate oxidation carrier complex protein SoxZ [Burkholderiales bacterium]|nr:thiosulfate oxidation carrier complex protein SoxZ [Burkholderiales bacterium]
MAQPMKIRATMQGESADVKVLISHPMETGQRRNERGELVPAHFITQVTATLNGKAVMSAQWSQAISRNPFLGFKVKGARPGDKVAVSWVDNKGDKSSIETAVAAS